MLNIHYHQSNPSIPERATIGASGYDLRSCESVIIPPMSRALVNTGIRLNIPRRFEGQVRSRSGLAAKHGVFVLNSPGTIDSDYRGEIKVILFNSGTDSFTINVGDRIAQLVFAAVFDASFIPASDAFFEESDRASNGFGSTGVK